jgi:hypothetical protein
VQSHNCAINATCTDNEGSFVCTCNAGHTGNGTICLGIFSSWFKSEGVYNSSQGI